MTYTVVGHPNTRTLRVLWAMEEIGLDWELSLALPQTDDILRHNPGGKVPALVDDGATVIDSVAIVTYLADKHGALTRPAGTLDRARQDSLTQFAVDELDGPLWTNAKHTFALPEKLQVDAVRATARAEWAHGCATLETRLGPGPLAMGDELTIPDIIIGHCAGWAKGGGFDWPDGRVATYFQTLLARPALKAALDKGNAATAAAT